MTLTSRQDAATVALPVPLPDKINLGCGWDHREGFLNVDLFDFHEPDLVADVTELAMLPSGHFREIVAQDVLEHLPRAKVAPALAEWSRLAAPDGTIHLRVPSLPDAAALLSRPERQTPDGAEEVIHLIYGTQAYGGDFHLSGFTFRSLAAQLARAGFQLCEARLRDEWLIEAQARKCTELRSAEERVHNRAVWLQGRPAAPDGIGALAARVAAQRLTDAEIDAALAEPRTAPPEAPRAEPPAEPTVIVPSSPPRPVEACSNVRTADLLRVVAGRVKYRLRHLAG